MTTEAHYFFAVKLTDPVKEELNHWASIVKQQAHFKTWVDMHDYHLTLAFLGKVEVPVLEKTIQILNNTALRVPEFPIYISKLGSFGREDQPRILWAGIEQNDWLNQVQKDVYQASLTAGITLDKRPFKPHITLAKKYQGNELPIRLLTLQENLEPIQSALVDSIVLYKTHLDRIPKYEEVSAIAFN